jgi:uncharacterized protein YbjQ (UPF0145 family)
MGQAGQGLMQPIMTSFRPQLDPNNVESLQRQAAFQGRIGDTEQARLFTGQALALEERNKAEEEKQRKLAEGQERVKALNAFRNAVASGDANAIVTARANLEAVGQTQGTSLLPQAAAIETNERQTKAAAATEAATVKALRLDNLEAGMRAAFNAVDSIEQADTILKNAPADVSEQAATAHKQVVDRITSQQKRAEEERNLRVVLPPSFEMVEQEGKLVIPSIADLEEPVRNLLNGMAQRLDADIKAANEAAANGKSIIPQATREALQRRRNDLEKEVTGALLKKADDEAKAKRQEQINFMEKAQAELVRNYSDTDSEEAQKDLKAQGYNVTLTEAENYLRQEAINRLFKTAPRADDDGVVDLDALQAGEDSKQSTAVPPEFQIFKFPNKDERTTFQKVRNIAETGVEVLTDLFAPRYVTDRIGED